MLYKTHQNTVEEAEKRATELGRVVRYPSPRELFVDIDTQEAFERCYGLVSDFKEKLGIIDTRATPSPSGREGRYHVVITLNRAVCDEYERVALQAMFASDPKRAILSWIQLDSGECDPRAVSVFFENPA